MKEELALRISMVWHPSSQELEMLVGLDGPTSENLVKRVLRHDNADVGVTEDGTPVFISICRAEQVFSSLSKRLSQKQTPTAAQIGHILRVTGEMALDVARQFEVGGRTASPPWEEQEWRDAKQSKLELQYA